MPRRGPLFWVAMWALLAAAEFVALIPVLWPEGPVPASDVVYRLVGALVRGLRPHRLAPAARQPRRAADDRDRAPGSCCSRC